MAKPIPDGFHTVSAHLIVQNAPRALDFYAEAFGAQIVMKAMMPDGQSLLHAEIKIGDSAVMLAEENAAWGARSPRSLGGSPVTLHLYVPDCDAVYDRATKAGCTILMPPADMFWGDRYAKVEDPFGHHWSIATHMEDVGAEEMQRRAAEAFSSGSGA
jgi:uncharacterized glyoxalase superfamily protein PhnB